MPTPTGAQPWPPVSLLIPTLNEAQSLPHVLPRIPASVSQVVIVDGGSTDDTVEVARSLRPDAVVVRQTRKGKGNALVCGFEACTGDIVVMIDADGSTAPEEIENFVRALVEGADFAKGSRYADGGASHDLTWMRSWGNRFLNGVVNALFRTRYSDLCYGYNAIWRHRLAELRLPPADDGTAGGKPQWGDGFEIETMVNIRAAVLGMRIAEVPSVEQSRIHGVSKLSATRDGIRVLRTILSEYAVRHRLRTSPMPVPELRQPHPAPQVPAYMPALAPEES
nr:glycosyltransferase family 2 protein [Allorhizocola rhizosphaerae]